MLRPQVVLRAAGQQIGASCELTAGWEANCGMRALRAYCESTLNGG
jgi:hypothetical protein